MNIINYLYSKSKNIYNRNINAYNYNNIENENLISHFSDNNNNNYSNNSHSSKSSAHTLVVSDRNFDRHVKKKNEHAEDSQEEYNERNETMASYLNKSGNIRDSKKKKKIINSIRNNSKLYIRNSNINNDKNDKNDKNNNNKILQHNSGIEKMSSNIENSKLCYEFNIYNIGFDKKVYKNRCDGVCVLNDNIYIFDKIKKCIYLYTPYNNVWYIFLDIYEEISIKKNNSDITNMYDMKNINEKQYVLHKYVNNISFLNYTDMVYLNDYLFIISSNSQFMNICKVNINNMNTLFGAIVIASSEKKKSNNSDINSDEKKKKEHIMKFGKNNNDASSRSYNKQCVKNKHGDLLINKTDIEGSYNSELSMYNYDMENCKTGKNCKNCKNCISGKNGKNCISGISGKNEGMDSGKEKGEGEISDEYIYVSGISKFDEFFDDEKNENSKKQIIKARDYFSLCSVNEKLCSLIYLFGGKGNTIKEKNEYIDIIYNDLYVYDFYMNKWIELHECTSDNVDDKYEINEEYYEHVHVENSNLHDHVNNYENFTNSNEGHKLYDFNVECYESFIPSEKNGGSGENGGDGGRVNKKDKLSVCEKNSNNMNSPTITTIKEYYSTKNLGGNKNEHYIDEQLFSGLEISNNVSKKKKKKNSIEEYNKNNTDQDDDDNNNDNNKDKDKDKDNLYNLIFDSISILSDGKSNNCLGNSTNVDLGSVGNSNASGEVKNGEVKNGEVKNDQVKVSCISCRKNGKCKYICEIIKKNIKIKKVKWLGRRAGHTCNYYKNNLYIFGGINYYSFNKNKINLNFCNNLFLYNIESNTCFEIIGKGNIPEKRYRHSSIIINDYMFIIGGECKNSTLPKNDLFFYNFENSVWSEIIINSTIGSHALYKSIWLENFGSIYMFGASILRFTKKDFQYTPSYKNNSSKEKILNKKK
ncbi:hypothetical protein, variant [Plasmodium yoelii 17X]|uniref:Kelch domain-containing protein n=1 Tax=Plasmodium yoelii 17X TaxID=1323249 RepID=V7PIW2_PLAYE|nr:hypothetical protein YYC_03898 [Plasmodium yoelii 17X]ETB58238.1 hypothetical protein, variant [Plasmodium yoelii 17X]